jgi:hypothetical protein
MTRKKTMNLYFLSLLKVDLERRKKKCLVLHVDDPPPLSVDYDKYFKENFNLTEGDIVILDIERKIVCYWIGDCLVDDDVLEVTDKKFHPYYWPGEQFHFCDSILDRILRSPLKFNGRHFFEKVKVGKSRFTIVVDFSPPRKLNAYKIMAKLWKKENFFFTYQNSELTLWL